MTAIVRPLFIFGVARSGTNLLAHALDAHPYSTVALDPLMPLFKTWRNATASRRADRLHRPFNPSSAFHDYYFDAGGAALLDAMLGADSDLPLSATAELRNAVCARAALESPELASAFAGWNGETAADLFAAALAIVADQARTSGKHDLAVAGVKEVWTVEFALPLARAFPDARFLIIHRDPRAVVASLVALMRKQPDQAAHPVSYMRHWRKHVAVAYHLAADSALAPRLMSVRFEDIVARPADELARICAFLDIPMHQSVLMDGDGATGLSNSSFNGGMPGIELAAADRWRRNIDPDLAVAIDFHCAPEMGLLGYQPDNADGTLTDGVRRSVAEANRNPGKWRSDSGDVAGDLDWERRRYAMLAGARANPAAIRRCFLFEDVFAALLAPLRTAPEIWNIAQ